MFLSDFVECDLLEPIILLDQIEQVFRKVIEVGPRSFDSHEFRDNLVLT